MTDLAVAAIAYAASNIAVFPLRPRMKMPYGRTTALYMATADVALTTARWAGEARLPLKPIEALREGARKAGRTVSDAELLKPVLAGAYANIGIATGAPAGFWVLDLDGPDAVLWLECKEAEHGPLPVTPTSLTARGRHLCFAWCDRSSAHPEIANRSGMEGAPVDVRGQGGYILAPPSVHPGDEKKGVPPGHVYRWAPGLSPADLDFARAPDWLITLVKPVEATASAGPVTQRAPTLGRASRFGELILDRVVATITSARVGSRDSTLYAESCGIGALVAGGEIEEAYARSTLEAAGRVHVPDAMSEAQLVRQVERALAYGAAHPRSARERSQRPVRASLASRPQYDAQRALDPEAYWNEGASALGSSAVAYWLDRLGLDPRGLPCALDRMRFHPEAPDHDGECRPMLLAPMSEAGRGPVRALAMFDLETASTRPAGFMGRSLDRRAMMLTSMAGPGPIVVGLDFADTWVLASRLAAKGPVRAAACLTVTSFAGGVLGDRWGRVDPVCPAGDPEFPPWRIPPDLIGPGETEVGFALRRDLVSAPMRFRGVVGGTAETRLRGDAASAYFTGLIVQAWERLALPEGARLTIRPMTPTDGVGFHEQQLRAAQAHHGVRQ